MVYMSVSEFAGHINKLPDQFILTSHINPDGDGLGAMFAMGTALKSLGKKIHYVLAEPVRDYYHFLPEHEHLKFELPEIDSEFVLMSFDCGSKERISLPDWSHLEKKATVINLDHHLSNDNFGDINLLEVNAISSCSIVYDLLLAMKAKINPQIATCLYMGLMYDTGRFAYSKDPQAFYFGGKLIEAGADHWAVYSALFRHNDLQQFRTMGELFLKLEEHLEGKLITLDINKDETHKINLEETENLINQVSNVKDIQMVIFFKYLEEEVTKVSFRSRGSVDVCALASSVGGGGHRNASGAVVKDNFHNTRNIIMEKAREILSC